jgi:hypothetical protein
MDWMQIAKKKAEKDALIIALRERAQWHREKARDVMNTSSYAMERHESDAQAMERTANLLVQEMIAKEGVKAGLFRSVLVGHHLQNGSYVEVLTDQGWVPFWSENRVLQPQSVPA